MAETDILKAINDLSLIAALGVACLMLWRELKTERGHRDRLIEQQISSYRDEIQALRGLNAKIASVSASDELLEAQRDMIRLLRENRPVPPFSSGDQPNA
jgi:hypothetical protein